METPGEPGAGPFGAPSLTSFAPGHLESEKLVKLEGWLVGQGGVAAQGPSWGQRRGKGSQLLASCSGLVPASRPAQDPLYDVPDAGGGQAGGPQRPGRTVSLRERLLLTRPVWLQLRANAAAALHALRTEPPGVSCAPSFQGLASRGWEGEGLDTRSESPNPVHSQTFLVRKSNTRQCQVLCVRLPEASGPSFVSSHYIQESPGGERNWPGGKGLETVRVGPGGFPRGHLHFPSLRRLLGELRARVPGPGPAHLCLLPRTVSLATGHLVSMGPAPLGHLVLPAPTGPLSPRSPKHASLLIFCSPFWPQGHPSPPAPAPQSHPPGSHAQGTGSHLPSGHW